MDIRTRKVLLRGVLLVLLCVFIGLIVWFVRSMMSDGKPTRRQAVQQISLLKPPPPPPPPKPEEKPPEPEIKKEEVKIDEPKQPDEAPKPAENEPPAGKDLGVDADGAAGGDNFGLVGRKGGRDLLGGVGGKYAGFSNLLRQQIQASLARDKQLRALDYKVVVKLWLSREGRVERYELAGSTGNPDTDKAINQALANLPSMHESPPEDMPQPVKLRVTSRF